jgi:uncharacterized protein (TIGR04255 family)
VESKVGPAGPLGTWRNPPLVYVVAELAISAHYGLASKIPTLQSALRALYPRTSELNEILIANVAIPQGIPAPLSPSTQQRWHLLDAENTRAVDVSYRSIALHATTYENSTDFLNRWTHVLAAIADSGLDLFVERAGLRYVDVIVPSEGHAAIDYLIPGLGGLQLPTSSKMQHCIWSTGFSIDGALMQVNTAAPSPTGMILPPNLLTVPLKIPNALASAQQQAPNQRTGWIDTDASKEIKQPFDAVALSAIYKALHGNVSQVFQALLSEHAIGEWK